MNCERFQGLLHDVARDEALDAGTLREALEHAEQCGECDVLLGEAEALSAGLRGLAECHAVDRAPARVEAELLRVFRERRVASLPHARRGGVWALATLGVGVAAALLVTIALRGPKPTRLRAPQNVASAASASSSSDDSAADSEQADLSLTSDPSVDPSDGWPVAYEGNSATAGSFVPLSDSFDPTTVDMNSVVRVAMSRPTLEGLGVYLDGSSDNPVIADVVVSGNGTPEAIRLVQW